MTTDRFLTLVDVAEILNISASQTYALVRSGDLKGIQIGGRNQWQVERIKLEEFFSRDEGAGVLPGRSPSWPSGLPASE